jgi:hypothetical protein
VNMRMELWTLGPLGHSQSMNASHTMSIPQPPGDLQSMYLLYTMSFKCKPATSSGAHMKKHKSLLILEEKLGVLDLCRAMGLFHLLYLCFCFWFCLFYLSPA